MFRSSTYFYITSLHLNISVKSYDGIILDAGPLQLKTRTLIWAAGVKGAPVAGLPTEVIIGNRIVVNEFNQVPGHENVFALGDVALQKSDKNPKGYPMLGAVAQQQGKALGKNLNLLISNKKMRPFTYINQGVMATIGRNSAVVDLKYWKFSGLFAWIVWMLVHLMLLVSFRNRVVVFINWVWNFSNSIKFRLLFWKYIIRCSLIGTVAWITSCFILGLIMRLLILLFSCYFKS